MSEQPDDSALLADRLGLCAPQTDDDVSLGGVPLTSLPHAVVRERIVVSDTQAALFAGRLADRIDERGKGGVDEALATASAEDILDSLPDGLDTVVTEKGRSFSGGQRQRLVLARALAADPEILVLVEPTSAVDAHTEVRIASRLKAHRAGRTTIVTTVSPLVLDAVDEVAFLVDGVVVAVGTHAELLADHPAYRTVVVRDVEVARERHDEAPDRRRQGRTPLRRSGRPSPPTVVVDSTGLHIAAALAALAAPRLLGDLVQSVEDGTTAAHVDEIVLWLAFFLVLQSVLTRFARYRSQVMGELVLAELREDFVSNTLALPIGTVEAAGSGDLLTRTGSDIDQLGWSVRWALPEWTIAVLSATLTFAAALSVGWWVALPCLLALPPLVIGLRWYLARAKDGYLAETASYSQINTTLSETVEGVAHRRGTRARAPAGAPRPTTTSRPRSRPSATPCTCARSSSRAWR